MSRLWFLIAIVGACRGADASRTWPPAPVHIEPFDGSIAALLDTAVDPLDTDVTVAANPFPLRFDCLDDERVGHIPQGTDGRMAYAEINVAADVVGLCDGRVLLADTVDDVLVVHDVVADASGAAWALDGSPRDLELVVGGAVVYAVDAEDTAYRLDLAEDTSAAFPVPGAPFEVDYDATGKLVVSHGAVDPADTGISVIDPVTGGIVTSTLRNVGLWLEVDRAADQVFLGRTAGSKSYLTRASHDPETDEIAIVQSVQAGRYGYDLALSPDGRHLGFAGAGANGSNEDIADFDTSDLGTRWGAFGVGGTPQGLAFSPDGTWAAGFDRKNKVVSLFGTESHESVDRWAVRACGGGAVSDLSWSVGGRVVYLIEQCSETTSRLHWRVVQ